MPSSSSLILGGLVLAGLSVGAVAQSAADDAALGEVVVSAQRVAQPAASYAGSFTRLSAADVALTGATHHAEVLNRAAGVLIQRGSGQESLTALRSPVLTGAGSCGAFLFLEDGVPIRPVGTCNVNELFEVNAEQAAAIEVLRGVGSALYGSNAVHGIVNVIPPRPAELPRAAVAIEAGPDDYGRLKLAGRASIGPGELGIAAHATHDGGWRDQSGFEEQKLSLAWQQPAGDDELLVRLTATRLDQETAGFLVGADSYRDPALASTNANPEAFRQARSARLLAHWSRSLDGGSVDVRATLRNSRMTFLQHFLLGKPQEDNGQDSAAVYLGRRWHWGTGTLVAGLDAELARSTLTEFQSGPTSEGSPAQRGVRPAGFHYDYVVDSRVGSAYVQWEQELPASLRASVGLRVEHVDYRYDNRMLDGNTADDGTPCGFGGCLYARPADRDDAFTQWGPRLGLTWQATPQLTAYASLSRGFRPPEATELYRLQRQQQVADLDAEQIEGSEVGLRYRDDRWRITVAAFALDKDDVILRDTDGFNIDAGRTRHRGVEYDLQASLGGGWTVALVGTRARHTYRFTRNVDGGERIVAGNDVDTAPRELDALRVAWQRDGLHAELEWQQVGEYWADAANTARYPGHDLLNLRVAAALTSTLSATLRVTNVLDREYADRADFAFGSYRYFPGRERAAFVELRWQRE